MGDFAIITGGAGGLGKAFGFELAKKGYSTILIDLPDKGLVSICNEIKNKYNLNSIFYETDLTKLENIIEITKDINEKYKGSILINNAGVGGTQRFDDVDINDLNTIIQLNVMATTIMIKQILPNLQKQGKSYILNVSSIAAFSPVAFKTAYPALKTYCRNICQATFKRNVLIIFNRNRFSWLLLKIVPIWIMLPLFSRVVRKELKNNCNG